MHKLDFFNIPRKDILRGLGYVYDSKVLDRAPKNDKMVAFAYDYNLQKLALWWLDCDQDMNLMKIKYHDEIAELPDYDDWMDKVRV